MEEAVIRGGMETHITTLMCATVQGITLEDIVKIVSAGLYFVSYSLVIALVLIIDIDFIDLIRREFFP